MAQYFNVSPFHLVPAVASLPVDLDINRFRASSDERAFRSAWREHRTYVDVFAKFHICDEPRKFHQLPMLAQNNGNIAFRLIQELNTFCYPCAHCSRLLYAVKCTVYGYVYSRVHRCTYYTVLVRHVCGIVVRSVRYFLVDGPRCMRSFKRISRIITVKYIHSWKRINYLVWVWLYNLYINIKSHFTFRGVRKPLLYVLYIVYAIL